MMNDFYFDFRDVFRSARIGLSSKKMFVLFGSLILAHGIYFVLGYCALLASGFSLQTIWGSYGLFPAAVTDHFTWYSWVMYGAGVVFCLIVYLFASTVVGRITFQQLKGDEFCTAGEAMRFTIRHWKAVFVSPFSFILIVLFLMFCGVILGLVARIPFVGELGFSLFLVPTTFVAICVVLLGVVTLLSFVLGPAIVATTGEDTMETCIQNFSTLWNQPWRLVVYEAILDASAAVGFYIFSQFTFLALLLIYWICGILMGPKMINLAGAALQYFPSCPFFQNFTQYFWCPEAANWLPIISSSQGMGITGQIAGIIAGLSLIIMMWIVVSYVWSTLTVGQVIIYLILRKKKDDENLLEREQDMQDLEAFPKEDEIECEQLEGDERQPEPGPGPDEPRFD
jgi:hypothetical protein